MGHIRVWGASAVLLGCAFAIGGCGGSPSSPSAEPLDLDGRSFIAEGATGRTLVPGADVTLAFLDGRISANAGCNQINAPADWTGGTITLTSPAASTMKMCGEEAMAQEQWFISFLEAGPALVPTDAGLDLEGDGVVLQMREQD